MTGAQYKGMLDGFLVPALRRHIPRSQVWFQQDGASPHTTRGVLDRLHSLFPGKVLSKGGTVPWPPRSPDLSPLDYFLWGQVSGTSPPPPYKGPYRTWPYVPVGAFANAEDTWKPCYPHSEVVSVLILSLSVQSTPCNFGYCPLN